MCPQIKVKNYDKVEKVSVCYHMKLNVEFIDGVILLWLLWQTNSQVWAHKSRALSRAPL